METALGIIGACVGITSFSPNMTLLADKDGVIINAKYKNTSNNADTEKLTALNKAFFKCKSNN